MTFDFTTLLYFLGIIFNVLEYIFVMLGILFFIKYLKK